MTNENTELALIEDISESNAPAIYGHSKLDQFYDSVKEKVTGEVPDLSTDKGRKRIASLAAKVSTSKKAVENPGREYLKRLKDLPKTIEKELREFVDKMDALRDEVRKPLTDWEDAEKERIEKHKKIIDSIRANAVLSDGESSEIILNLISETESIEINNSLEEFEIEAHRAKQESLDILCRKYAAQKKYEEEQAELERLRKEAAEREQNEREERIAREAAEQARINAERAAAEEQQRIKDEAERKEREAALAIERAQREKAEAELREQQAKERAERERVQAEENARIAAENARQEEIRRQQQEQQRIADEQASREKDRKHKAAVNNQILADLMAQGLPEECAKNAIRAIASGKVSNVSIRY